MDSRKALILNRNEERRLRAGHLWVFSNEVDKQRSPLKSFEPGQCADVIDANGKPLGTALVNPHSLICARLISRKARDQTVCEVVSTQADRGTGLARSSLPETVLPAGLRRV